MKVLNEKEVFAVCGGSGIFECGIYNPGLEDIKSGNFTVNRVATVIFSDDMGCKYMPTLISSVEKNPKYKVMCVSCVSEYDGLPDSKSML